MNCILIVNLNGLLSACPTQEVFDANNFFTDPKRFLVQSLKIAATTYQHLWENRDNAFILHPDLPAKTSHPERVWYQIENGYLKKAKV